MCNALKLQQDLEGLPFVYGHDNVKFTYENEEVSGAQITLTVHEKTTCDVVICFTPNPHVSVQRLSLAGALQKELDGLIKNQMQRGADLFEILLTIQDFARAHKMDTTSICEPSTEKTSLTSVPVYIFSESNVIVDRKSKFQGFVCAVNSLAEVHRAYSQLKEEHRRATHLMMAYRLRVPPPKPKGVSSDTLVADHDSDGEKAAGSRLQQLLHLLQIDNVLVVVLRWYGGIQLGPKRFQHILNAAREALVKAKFIKT